MKIDNVLVLAAGKGSRMGKIGQKLPKVLWPIFEKPILELEIEYSKRFTLGNIFINNYFHLDALKEYISKKKFDERIKLVEEDQELDIGGGIHNVAKLLNYSGNLLIINSDQFLMMNDSILNSALSALNDHDGVMFTTSVNSRDGYNALEVDGQSIFKGVVLNKELQTNTQIQTYIGCSLINLTKLENEQGKSNFFKTIANPDKRNFKCINVDECNYWDFGTYGQYYENMFKLLDAKDEFKDFLIANKAFHPSKVKAESYGNFLVDNKIVIKNNNSMLSYKAKGIVFEDLFQEV